MFGRSDCEVLCNGQGVVNNELVIILWAQQSSCYFMQRSPIKKKTTLAFGNHFKNHEYYFVVMCFKNLFYFSLFV